MALKLGIPEWCREAAIALNGEKVPTTESRGYCVTRRTWTARDELVLNLQLGPRLVAGEHSNQGNVALIYGPLVLAADEALLAESGLRLTSFAIPTTNLSGLAVAPEAGPGPFKTWNGARLFSLNAVGRKSAVPIKVRLVPFADAGGTGSRYKVWLPLPRKPSTNLLFDEAESRSREGNLAGAMNR